MQSSQRLSSPTYGLTVQGQTIWAVGSSGYQRFRFTEAGPGLRPLGDFIEVASKTLMSVDASRAGVWAVGGGDGGDPLGEALRLGRKRVVERIPLSGSSPYDVLALGGTLWVADAAGDTVDIVYPNDIDAPRGYRFAESQVVGERLLRVIAARGAIFALSSGSGGHSWARMNPGTGEVDLLVKAGRCPIDIAVGAGSVWTADYCRHVVRRFSFEGELLGEIAVGHRPTTLDFEYDTLWVGSRGEVVSISPQRERITARFSVGGRVNDLIVERGSLLVAHRSRLTRILLEL